MGGMFGRKRTPARSECGYSAGEGKLRGEVVVDFIRNLRRGGSGGNRIKGGGIESDDWPLGGTVGFWIRGCHICRWNFRGGGSAVRSGVKRYLQRSLFHGWLWWL